MPRNLRILIQPKVLGTLIFGFLVGLSPIQGHGELSEFDKDGDSGIGSLKGSLELGGQSSGAESNGLSLYPPVSYSGRYVGFHSIASNLVPDDTNDEGDIFVHDRKTRTTTRVSVNSAGIQGNGNSIWPSLSGSGRYVAFTSEASNLVDNDENNTADVFVHDRKTGETSRVSVGPKGESNGFSYTYFPSISADGRFVTFASLATNLVPHDTNNVQDIFVHDRWTAQTWLVTVGAEGDEANGASFHAVISGDGRYVAFHSEATNLVENDTNEVSDIFVRDLWTQQTQRVSVAANGEEANGACDRASISFDGNRIAYSSLASNLVLKDTNEVEDVFFYDRLTGTTKRASVGPHGRESFEVADEVSELIIPTIFCCIHEIPECCIIDIVDRKSVISASGGDVVYRSVSHDLVWDDNNGLVDVFVYDIDSETTTRVSVDSHGREGNGVSVHHGVSFDGRYVAFSSEATNLVENDTNGVSDIFVHDRVTGETTRISVASEPRKP